MFGRKGQESYFLLIFGQESAKNFRVDLVKVTPKNRIIYREWLSGYKVLSFIVPEPVLVTAGLYGL